MIYQGLAILCWHCPKDFTYIFVIIRHFWIKYYSCSVVFSQVNGVTESLGSSFMTTQQIRGRTAQYQLCHKPLYLQHEAVGPDPLRYLLQLLHWLPQEACQIKPIRPQTAFPIQFKKYLLTVLVCYMPGVIYLWFSSIYANSALEQSYTLASKEIGSQI